MKTKAIFFIAALVFTVFSQINAQNKANLLKIETKDGNEFVGILVSEDDEKLVINTENFGEISLRKNIIVKRSEVESSKLIEGVLWDDNPQATRYLWTPNGYGLKAGEGYYQNIWVFYNQLSYGFTNMFSVSAGTIPLFLFGAEGYTPVWIVPKFSFPIEKDKVNLGAGIFAGTVLGVSESNFGIAFGTLTLGDRNRNLSLALGWGYSTVGWADKPVINLSGMARVTSRGYFLTENYYMPFGGEFDMLVLSFGYRYVIKKVGLDFGLYLPFAKDMDGLYGLPTVGVTVPFGNGVK